jgi:hypothetical protein
VDAGDDWLLRFLEEFSSMPEHERDAAIESLPAERREALLALADARAEAEQADLIAALDAGHAGLDRLYRATDPAELFAVLRLAVAEHPTIVVEALFAAVVAHRSWAPGEPSAILALRERWIWHLHEMIRTADQGEEPPDPGSG